MPPFQVLILSFSVIICTAIAGAAWVMKDRYEFVPAAGNPVMWKLDKLTGQAYGCEESEFGPFCIPAPNQIKHAP